MRWDEKANPQAEYREVSNWSSGLEAQEEVGREEDYQCGAIHDHRAGRE
jgi:hypothetical protein